MTVGFDSTPDVTQDFTDNTELLSKGVRALKAGGGTAMYDALYYACRDKLMKHEQTGPVRRAIILLSDGDDNSSHVTREEAIEMAESHVGRKPSITLMHFPPILMADVAGVPESIPKHDLESVGAPAS